MAMVYVDSLNAIYPTNWEKHKLHDLCTINYGQSPNRILDQDGIYPVVGTSGTTRKGNDYFIDGETVIIGRKGSIAKPYYYNEKIWVIDTAFFTSDHKNLDCRWLFYYLDNSKLARLNESTGVPSLSRATLYNIELWCPPILEQQKISQILSTWDRAIERVQRLIEAKQRQKKGLMQGLLTGRLRFPEFGEPTEELGNIPDGWKSVEFHECATRSNKKIDPATNDLNFRCVELEHISQESGKIIGETESKQQTSSKNYFRPGNVLFGKLRPYLHKFAFCDFEGVCSSEIWVLQNKSICTSRYLFYLIQTDTFILASVKTTGTKMPRSDWSVVRKTKFFLPSLEEQERITAFLDQVELNIKLLERYIVQLKQQKKGLMQQLLTGEIRVKVD